MRVLVCGGRDFSNKELLEDILKQYNIQVIIEGGARGADTLARLYGLEKGIPVITFTAKWALFGKAAGYIRNQEMLDEGIPDLVIAFPGGRGTRNMIDQARKAGVPVHVVDFTS